MMQTSKDRFGNNFALFRWLNCAMHRCVTLKRLVWTIRVIVFEVLTENSIQMRFAYYNDVIKAFTTYRAEKALGVSVLPR